MPSPRAICSAPSAGSKPKLANTELKLLVCNAADNVARAPWNSGDETWTRAGELMCCDVQQPRSQEMPAATHRLNEALWGALRLRQQRKQACLHCFVLKHRQHGLQVHDMAQRRRRFGLASDCLHRCGQRLQCDHTSTGTTGTACCSCGCGYVRTSNTHMANNTRARCKSE